MVILIVIAIVLFFELPKWLPEKIPGIERSELIGVIIGLLVTYALGPSIGILMEFIKPPGCAVGMHRRTYDTLTRNNWMERETKEKRVLDEIRSLFKFSGGSCIGFLERTLYFIAFIKNPLYIAGLLTFKVAAKWEAWNNIVKVPEKNVGLTESSSEFALFRFQLGGYYMTRFLVGTFSNVLFAFIGYLSYEWVLKVLNPPMPSMFPSWMPFLPF